MLFDVDAALAEIVAHDTATPATTATNPPEMRLVSQMSPLSQRRAAENKPQPLHPAPSRPEPDAFPCGVSTTGRPRTWTGKIVSLDDWRRLTDWDKHGSTGKLFCGACREWVMPGGCPHTDGGAA